MFTKLDPSAPDGFFEAEAAGLAWLAEAGGARCVKVERVGPDRIDLEELTSARPSREAARRFGELLAVTHRAGAPAFGSPPAGWEGPSFIGRREMSVREHEQWSDFYVLERVMPYAEQAVGRGNLTAEGYRTVARACDLIRSGIFDDGEPPARVHGDLWSGNVMWTQTGVVLIDPAAHGGHRETDLAMLVLFGAPFVDDILAGYDKAAPLAPGWAGRVPMHQLFPLAVHAVGHGPSYGIELERAASAVLRFGAGSAS
ncbi:fructosamine kinase family protein [Herbiconiux moechotypicola]|uniref:Fructosamine kinase family protein n=1 Tax=Herbiconiux moechotypicola TaxID=637393 RepID=A0ABN3DTW7_9MICO|nr:fructosamine kinase family protein [Herbiconiux moechotypicola]MCS5730528.1 fructosamine kinase family protein [Herbiconiux moechotypicola]